MTLNTPFTPREDWEFNVLGIYNYRKHGSFDAFMGFVRDHHASMPGDIVEAGVYRGGSLLAIALLLRELGSPKKVYGFDSFAGFPPVLHANDDFAAFSALHAAGAITKAHFDAATRNREWVSAFRGPAGDSTATVSTSGTFSGTSLDLLRRKIDLLGLDNVILVDGAFHDTMPAASEPKQIFAAVVDCDLYQSYLDSFGFIWPRLVDNGFVHLDEYFSLKFPGARVATNEFVAAHSDARLDKAAAHPGEFERWNLRKVR